MTDDASWALDRLWRTVRPKRRPRHLGSNLIRLPPTDVGLRLETDADTEGAERSPASWGGRIALRGPGGVEVFPVEFDHGSASVIVPVQASSEAWLIVGVWNAEYDAASETEQFGWTYQIRYGLEDSSPRACNSGSHTGTAWFLAVLLVVTRRSRSPAGA